MLNDWINLPNGQRLHGTTVYARMNDLGWDRAAARSKLCGKYVKRNGSLNIADAARQLGLHPTHVQRVMRVWQCSFADACVYVRDGGR